jgi:pyruvate dehydrogenase E1 component alpha subunit
MPMKKVFEGSVDYIQILDKNGKVDKKLEPEIPEETLISMYRYMVLARKWDKKCLALQRTGRMYTYAPLEGQEAIQVGATLVMDKKDWSFPTYRESFVYHMRGAPLWLLNVGWKGIEDGLKLDKELRCFPYAVPIGTQHPMATGAAYAVKMKKEKAAVLCFGGDGSTSEGEFHDGLNFAGVLQTPSVFLISNNQYAISVPRKWQTASKTIAQKAMAYGLTGVQIDGNDILAVYTVVAEAMKKAREGKGPTLIEAVTYRMGPHTTADDPKKYRSDDEVAYWKERDPIERFRKYLTEKKILDEKKEKEIDDEATKIVEDAVAESEKFVPDPKEMFKHVYGGPLTKNLQEQMEEAFRGDD